MAVERHKLAERAAALRNEPDVRKAYVTDIDGEPQLVVKTEDPTGRTTRFVVTEKEANPPKNLLQRVRQKLRVWRL
jgi:hypothetical protein